MSSYCLLVIKVTLSRDFTFVVYATQCVTVKKPITQKGAYG